MTKILYSSGLRLMECIRLRMEDLDFDRAKIYIGASKVGKDRVTLFPPPKHYPQISFNITSCLHLGQSILKMSGLLNSSPGFPDSTGISSS